jgi:hypothetical protein
VRSGRTDRLARTPVNADAMINDVAAVPLKMGVDLMKAFEQVAATEDARATLSVLFQLRNERSSRMECGRDELTASLVPLQHILSKEEIMPCAPYRGALDHDVPYISDDSFVPPAHFGTSGAVAWSAVGTN